jgi:hypothetical protein
MNRDLARGSEALSEFPNGTEITSKYKDWRVHGTVRDGRICGTTYTQPSGEVEVLPEHHTYTSISEWRGRLTDRVTGRRISANGWNFSRYRLPGSDIWENAAGFRNVAQPVVAAAVEIQISPLQLALEQEQKKMQGAEKRLQEATEIMQGAEKALQEANKRMQEARDGIENHRQSCIRIERLLNPIRA